MIDRRGFLLGAGATLVGMLRARPGRGSGAEAEGGSEEVTLCLLGDVMTGRGIDQVLPHSNPPVLYEPYVKSAVRYVELAESVNGPIPRPVAPGYVWGDALDELDRSSPDLRIVNLETAVTRSGEPWPGKGIHYRMHPGNVDCLTSAGIDACSLANNHLLDWSRPGLAETLETLGGAGIRTAGAGPDLERAAAPIALDLPGGGRLLLVACGTRDSGIPSDWAATPERSGVHLLAGASPAEARRIGALLEPVRRPGDLVVLSIHWGGNWGYEVPDDHRRFARLLVDEAGVDLVHGHSSHHPRPMEIHAGRLILYGCGDFLNDYEGISGHEAYRGDLVLMYLVTLDAASGALRAARMTPFRLRRFQPRRAGAEDARWLADTLTRQSRELGTRLEVDEAARLRLRW